MLCGEADLHRCLLSRDSVREAGKSNRDGSDERMKNRTHDSPQSC